MTQFSILELVRLREGGTARNALDDARDLASHAEALGYKRIWVAEHHNTPGLAGAATSVVLAHIGGGTKTIRIAAGGIMLPNHSPYVIAEQFGTLAHLFPGRVDLGLGRAPGTDPLAIRAIRRPPGSVESFPQDIRVLQAFFGPPGKAQSVIASPAHGTRVPLTILGSSLYGAQLAAELGLPYGFASHFAPDQLESAITLYRERFKPSAQLERPYVIVGVNVIAADTDAAAKRLATSQQQSFCDLFREGNAGPLQPPIDDIEDYWSPAEKMQAARMLARSIVGSPATVKAGIGRLIEETGADEVLMVTDVFEHAARLRSLEIVAREMQIGPTEPLAQTG